jgi:hypothetical protein
MGTHSSWRTGAVQREFQGVLSLAFLAVSCCVLGLNSAATAQVAETRNNHIIGARFESGPQTGELTLLFTISPTIRVEPIVRWLTATTKAKTLTVRGDSSSKYSVVLGDTHGAADGQVLIELSDSKSGLHELHSVDFAQREVLASRPSSTSSRDGHFVVFTKPAGKAQRLLIGSSQQPMGPLPSGVSADAVTGAYSLEFLPPVEKVDGWQLTMTVPSADVRIALFYLAKAGATWKTLEVKPLEGHPLVVAKVPGPGIYLAVRKAKP